MTGQRQRILVVGHDRSTRRAGEALADRAGFGLSQYRIAHDALRHLANSSFASWTVLVPGALIGLDAAAFVTAARDLLGTAAKIIVAGVDPVSAQAASLISAGATSCVDDATHIHHPSLALGTAAA